MKKKTKHRGGLSPDKYLSHEEVTQIIDHLEAKHKQRMNQASKTDLMITKTFLGSGLRAQELCDLTLSDMPTHHNKPVIYVRDGKGSVSRSVIISPRLKDDLEEYVNDFLADDPPETPVFRNCLGGKMSYSSLRQKYRILGEKLKLPSRLHCHRFRHTFAIRLYAIEHDLVFVAKQLGHANIQTTMIYADTSPEAAMRQMAKMR
jgi:integrase/recombinase XerD